MSQPNHNKTVYTARPCDETGYIDYSEQDHHTWSTLLARQKKIIPQRACPSFIRGVEAMQFSTSRVPQLQDINRHLQATGWTVKAVSGTLAESEFFSLLANRQFPAATFVRDPQELDYLQQPDLFHEFFGHCPLLTHPVYADFVAWYGQFALQASPAARVILCRLFWYTIEFGLILHKGQARILGGGILSSYQETLSCLDLAQAKHRAFDLKSILNCDYDYTQIQPHYFVLQHWDQLESIMKQQEQVLQWAEHIKPNSTINDK